MLRGEIGHVLLRVAAGVAPGRQQRQRLLFAEATLLDQQEVIDEHALLLDARRVRRRGAGRAPADVGVVAARADVEQRSEEHTSELQSLMRTSYAVFCLKKK